MASCKECIHFDRCKGLYKFDRLQKAVSKGCSYFKDRSRFVELPIKPGAFLFVPFRNQISKFMVIAVSFGQFGMWIDRTLISGIDCPPVLTCVEAFGKTVFLSRKEAERALKKHL